MGETLFRGGGTAGCRSPLVSYRNKETRGLIARLREEGWIVARKGPGDHVQYKHPTKPGRVTLDTGRRAQALGTLRSIYRQAGWEW